MERKINLVKKKSINILRNKVSANDIIVFISAEAPTKILICLEIKLKCVKIFVSR